MADEKAGLFPGGSKGTPLLAFVPPAYRIFAENVVRTFSTSSFLLGFVACAVLLYIPSISVSSSQAQSRSSGALLPRDPVADAISRFQCSSGNPFTPWQHWDQIKTTLPPAPCLVQGMAIEDLDEHHNFRRHADMGCVADPEDKTMLMPYLRATRDLALSTASRRILVDFGSRNFESSVAWFIQTYPLDFTEIHTFEMNKALFVKPKFQATGSPCKPSPAAPTLPGWVLDRVTLHNVIVGKVYPPLVPPPGVASINATQYLLHELQVTPQDAVIVKMDIDGPEYDILEEWMKIPSMSSLVDELFVEVHYHHPTMEEYHWTKERFTHTREDATDLVRRLRAAGFYTHPWP